MQIVSRKEAQAKGAKYYFTGKPCKNGHIAARRVVNSSCYECHKLSSAKWAEENKPARAEMWSRWKERNKDSIKQKAAIWRKNNKETVASSMKQWRERNKPRIKQYNDCWREKNKAAHAEMSKAWRRKNIERVRSRQRERFASDPLYNISKSMRNLVSSAFRNKGFGKSAKAEEIIGCDWETLKSHIERQFAKGMTWENRSEWHIDHIVPMASAKTEGDVLRLNHFTNLRPLWAIDNLKKSNSAIFLL